jgi:hypothetical protein
MVSDLLRVPVPGGTTCRGRGVYIDAHVGRVLEWRLCVLQFVFRVYLEMMQLPSLGFRLVSTLPVTCRVCECMGV